MNTIEAPLWARKIHNLLLLHENARNEREASTMASAVCASIRRHIREQYALDDNHAHRRIHGEGHGSRRSQNVG